MKKSNTSFYPSHTLPTLPTLPHSLDDPTLHHGAEIIPLSVAATTALGTLHTPGLFSSTSVATCVWSTYRCY